MYLEVEAKTTLLDGNSRRGLSVGHVRKKGCIFTHHICLYCDLMVLVLDVIPSTSTQSIIFYIRQV